MSLYLAASSGVSLRSRTIRFMSSPSLHIVRRYRVDSVVVDQVINDNQPSAGAGDTEKRWPARCTTDAGAGLGVLHHVFNLIRGHVMLEAMLHIAFRVIIQVPNNGEKGHQRAPSSNR